MFGTGPRFTRHLIPITTEAMTPHDRKVLG